MGIAATHSWFGCCLFIGIAATTEGLLSIWIAATIIDLGCFLIIIGSAATNDLGAVYSLELWLLKYNHWFGVLSINRNCGYIWFGCCLLIGIAATIGLEGQTDVYILTKGHDNAIERPGQKGHDNAIERPGQKPIDQTIPSNSQDAIERPGQKPIDEQTIPINRQEHKQLIEIPIGRAQHEPILWTISIDTRDTKHDV